MWNLGAHVEADGVKIVGFVVTKRIAWPDIERFTVLPSGRYPYVGYVVRKGPHRPVVISAIGTAGGETEKHRLEAQGPIDLLNKALADWRQAHEAPNPA